MRGTQNRIGFAVQLGTARFLGAFLDDPTQMPSAVITTMARQLGEAPAPCLASYRDNRQRWRHAATIREHYGFRDLEEDQAAGFRLTRWLYVLCWTGDDQPGLLFDQETDLEPTEIMTDTAAYADTVFGLFWLLGYPFSPRLADIGDARFWRIDKTAHYGPLDGLARYRTDIELIKRNWEDLLRLPGSLKLGRIHAGAIMRVPQVRERPTTLRRALVELGRITKTLHMLGYVDSKEKRRRILTQINRHEFRHRLARRVCHGDRGEIRKAHRLEQKEQLGALGLTLNAIALWNSTYIQAAIDQLTREGWNIDQADIAAPP